MSAITLVWGLFRALPAAGQIGSIVALVGLLLGAWGGWEWKKHSLREEGYERAIVDVSKANDIATERVRDAVSKPRACRDSGGEWDITRGVCTPR
jgi:hypothetical protein